MIIHDSEVAFLEKAVRASGFPKNDDPTMDYNRAKRLSKVPSGSGHDCYLKGISVYLELSADHSWWLQALRYHWFDVISSQSKMHSITKMELVYKKYVSLGNSDFLNGLIQEFNNWDNKRIINNLAGITFSYVNYTGNTVYITSKHDLFEAIIDNCPMGLMLKAGITTNYLQLKTMYNQRKNHKMSSWKTFCEWVETLPHSYLITGGKNE